MEIATNAGGSMLNSSHRERPSPAAVSATAPRSLAAPADVVSASEKAPATAKLAAEPRFAVLIELMERLTGREITLLPPATLMLGARTHTESRFDENQPAPAGNAQIAGVRATGDGQVYRIDATASRNGGGAESVHIDIELNVVQAQANSGGSQPGPLRVEISADAAASEPTEPLRIQSVGADVVRVTAPNAGPGHEA